MATIAKEYGQIDILVQSAGITGATGLQCHEVDPANFDLVMAINLKGVFLCCNKYYMRRALTPTMELTLTPAKPARFPAVLKVSDTQFYVGTRIILKEDDWADTWSDASGGLLPSPAVAKRQAFCYRWAKHFGWADEVGWLACVDVANRGKVTQQEVADALVAKGRLGVKSGGGNYSLFGHDIFQNTAALALGS